MVSATMDDYMDNRGYVWYNTSDQGREERFWGQYDYDREAMSVSGESFLSIHEGDITYQRGDFDGTGRVPVIWSCSGMRYDIDRLQEAVTAIPSALPTTELGKFTIQSNVSGGPIEVICPTDQAPDAVLYQIDSVTGYAYATNNNSGVINYYYGETPADFNGSDDAILFTINDNISNINGIAFYYTQSDTSMGGPNLATTSIPGDSTSHTVQSGSYKVKAYYNQAVQGGYGKYLQIMFSWYSYASNPEQSIQWAQEALSKITFFGVVRPDPTLGAIVNLNRYELGNTATITNPSGLTQAGVYTDPITKKQSVYLPNSMPSDWTANRNIAQAFQYGSTYNSMSNYAYGTKLYKAYKYTSSPERYQFAYCTDWDAANKLMTFVAYDNDGNAIEKWTLDYTSTYSNVWTTTPISSGGTEYTAGDYISIENDEIAVTGVGNLVAGDNITITESGNNITISSEGGGSTYTAGQYISIDSNDVIAVTGLAPVSGSDGIAVNNNVVSLDTPVEIVPGDNITISVTGASAIISAQGGGVTEAQLYDATVTAVQAATGAIPTFTEGNCVDITSNVISWETSAGITDIVTVSALPANPVATVIYLIPET